jgi:hypothetical protein
LELEKIITEVGVVESIAIAQEGGETDFQALESIEMTSEKLSYRNVLSDATTVKSRYPFAEGDELTYNGDIMEDSFAVVAYTGNGSAQTINTGIESYDINYDVARTMTAGSGNNTEYAFDRATMKLWKYINVTPAAGATLAEGADFTEVADDVEIDFKSSRVWVKTRSIVDGNVNFDTLRGAFKRVFTEETSAESTAPSTVEFTSNGINHVGSGYNINATTYVAWQWAYNKIKITTTNQGKRAIVAFTEGERSITLYEGSGADAHEVPHGLGVQADFMVTKSLDAAIYWKTSDNTNRMRLNDTHAGISDVYVAVSGVTTTDLGTNDTSSNTTNEAYIMYSEASKAGQIKIDTYTGTGTAGNYVDCGFEPEYVMIKRTDGVSDWYTLDSTRGTSGISTTLLLSPNTSNIENTSVNTGIDFYGNGFASVGSNVNTNGGTYLFIAYAKGSKAKKTIGTDTAAVTGVSTTNTKNFATIPYTGTGASQAIVTGISSVDFTVSANGSDRWFDRSTFEVKNDAGAVIEAGVVEVNTSKIHVKDLDGSYSHRVFDSIRGRGNSIYTDLTALEEFEYSSWVTAFNSDGFSVTGTTGVNSSGNEHIAYQTLYTHVRIQSLHE